ncbi:hypothetical protein RQ831_17855 [Roseomonas gilardii]|uniref:Transporter n=1 Tax=Roseomonas gilardii TaxID=257708 RepID=A0A1L7AM78_9PROT|nr:hypothetical protein [Roseomonas gilardii]APT59875.1 hypothetical protein RGI145_21465 [Roseomonas gilardii]MDT8332923.1 hypothetical protein [Roseomonas gilardii]PZR08110.1 MAG: hypothetical protein DI532_22595 [Azospirillum brasilense]
MRCHPVRRTAILLAALCPALLPGTARSQMRPPSETSQSAEALAKQVADPIANLISVPLQNNMDFGNGPKNALQNTLNVQPVIPVALGGGWSVITRTILPVIYHGSTVTGDEYRTGLGDTSFSAFFVPPTAPGAPKFGFGPVIHIPTATDDQLGNRRWGAGPTGIYVQETAQWTFGVLASHLWSFGASRERPEMNLTAVQPFVARHFEGGFTLTVTSETAYDWTTRQFTVPLNVTASQIVKIGRMPVSLFFGPRIYLQRPSQGPDWGLRFGVQFLFPT